MIDILDKYKNRLINISGKNRSLVTKKLYKKRAFDLCKLNKFDENMSNEVVDFIMNRKNGLLKIVDDHVKFTQEETCKLEKLLENEKKTDIKKIKMNKGNDEQKLLDDLHIKYSDKLEIGLKNIKDKADELADNSNSINYLLREINSLEKETGRYELYIGYPFVEGYFKDGTFTKAPLCLFPIKVLQDKGIWYLENINSQDIILNKVLLIASSKYNKIKVDEIETDIENIIDRFKNIDGVLEYLSEYGIHIKRELKDSSIKFKETKKDTKIPYSNGELVINPYLILGQFPVANSIYNDYKELGDFYNEANSGKENLLLNKLLLNDKKYSNIDINEENSYYRNKDFSEKDFYFVSSLDYSQEKALKTVNETDQLVIYGPPGTGKSQTIANIISDSLAKDKKVLMVSQKRAALDVIYNRLGNLNSKTVLIHDANKDKKSFYEKVVLEIESSLADKNSMLNLKIKDKAQSIDNEIEKLTILGEVLTKPREFGINLQQMYTLSKELSSDNKQKYDRYRIFRKNNFAMNIKYNSLKEITERLKENNYWNYYKKCKDFENENCKLKIFKPNMDKMDTDDFIDDLKSIKDKYSNKVEISINNNKYISKYWGIYRSLDQIVNDKDIKELAENINKEENSRLLNSLKKIDFLNNFDGKGKVFSKLFELYNELDDIINEDIIIELANSINNERNSYLLNYIEKSEYLSSVNIVNDDKFDKFMNLYENIEDSLDDDEMRKLAIEINNNENSYLLNPLTKEDYLKSVDTTVKKYFERIYSLYTFLEECIDEEKILELSEKINKEENEYLLERIDYGNWWTLSYWKNKNTNMQKEIDNKDKFEKRKKYTEELLIGYKKEIDKYIVETKKNNKEEFYSREQILIEKYTIYKNNISDFVKLTKENNNTEYENKCKEILDELNGYKDSISEYVIENKFKNKEEYNKRLNNIQCILMEYKKSIEEFKKDIKLLDSFIIKDCTEEYKKIVYSRSSLNKYIDDCINALDIYDEYAQVSNYIKKLKKLELDFLDYIYKYGVIKKGSIEDIDEVFEFIILYNINEVEKIEKLELLTYKDFKQIVDRTNKLMNEKQKLTPQYIVNKLNEDFSLKKQNTIRQEMREFERQASKKRMLWSIRKYLSEFGDILLDLFPCWLLAPDTVSEILPLVSGIFDIVIFDEASQMFIENAIPTIYRGKKVIIAGDDKQLRPTAMFKSKIDDSEEEFDEAETAAALEEESLLDLAKVNYDSVYLNYHYRSKYDELINFSNYAFYGGRLQVSPNLVKTDIVKDKPIERIKVDGNWIDRKNIKEAEEVVRLVKDILINRKKNETVGIITFNISQQDLIEDYLDTECNKDPLFKKLYLKEKNIIENNEDVSIFIKNIENVQGDERDIIIFSIGYGRNEKNRVSLNFGSLSQDGGENRLNVAISRAKEKIYVITSIEPDELGNMDNTKHNGPKLFKKYLEYVSYISEGAQEEANVVLNSLVDSDIKRNTVVTFDSPFEEEVYEELIKSGLSIDTQVGVSGYKIDLAIYNTKTSQYVMGIECDGAAYHSSKSARERDIHRQRYLESRGWKISRIWSRDWWEDPRNEIAKIQKSISDLI